MKILRRNAPRFFSLADQAFVSGINFLTTLVLARVLMPSGFGIFTLAYSLLLVAKNIHLAAITAPLMIIGGGLAPADFRRFIPTIALLHIGFVGLAAILLGAAVPLVELMTNQEGVPWLVLAYATSAVLSQEYVRKVLFASRNRRGALGNDVVAYGTQITAVVLAHFFWGLTPSTAILAIGAGSSLAVVMGAFQIKLDPVLLRRPELEFVRPTWEFGKWLIGMYGALWVAERWYLFVLAARVTTVETGVLAAALTLYGVSNIGFLAFENHAAPTLAMRVATNGPRSIRPIFSQVIIKGGVVFFIFCGLMATLGPALFVRLYGEDYSDHSWVLPGLAVAVFLGFFSRVAVIGLKVMHRSKQIFAAYFAGGALTLLTATPLVEVWGLKGAVGGMALTQCFLAVAINYFLWHSMRSETSGNGGIEAVGEMISPPESFHSPRST